MTTVSAFTVLVFAHFCADWLPQSHDEAMRKSREWRVRARHCLSYSAIVAIVAGCLGASSVAVLGAFVWLWATHFIEDTYIPVYLWARYIRGVPGLDSKHEFVTWFQTPLGAILAITVDQIVHIGCLWPVAWLCAGWLGRLRWW